MQTEPLNRRMIKIKSIETLVAVITAMLQQMLTKEAQAIEAVSKFMTILQNYSKKRIFFHKMSNEHNQNQKRSRPSLCRDYKKNMSSSWYQKREIIEKRKG